MRSILITGCSSGIGYDAAHALKARGWRVFATCRQQGDCDRLIGEGLESFPLDYASEDSIAAAVAETLSRTGGTLDALFNNGAFACPGAVEDLPRGALREIFETNLFGYHDLTRRLVPQHRGKRHGQCTLDRFQVGVAQAGRADAHQHVAGLHRPDIQGLDGHGRLGLAQHGGFGLRHDRFLLPPV